MMRKLIKFGKNSYVISLPKEWVEANKLQKGSSLYVEQKPSSIIITATPSERRERRGVINIDKKTITLLETELMANYRAGVTHCTITGNDLPARATKLKELIHYLAGIEIVEQGLHKITIIDMIDIQQVALPSLIHRMDMMIRTTFEDTLGEPPVSASILRERDLDINRIQLLVARVAHLIFEEPSIGNMLKLTPTSAFYHDRVAWTLERIADYVKRFNDDLHRAPAKRKELLKKHFRRAYRLYQATIKHYYQQKKEESLQLHDRIRGLLGEYTMIVRETRQPDEVLALENVKNILRDLRIILRITIEQAVKPKSIKSSQRA